MARNPGPFHLVAGPARIDNRHSMSTATPSPGVPPSMSSNDPGPTVPRPPHVQRLERAIAERTARVGVIGLGYVGLPLVELFAGRGFPVLGLDIDVNKVAR